MDNKAAETAPPGNEPKAFPIVAIGASAGGLEAMTELMQHLPGNTGMAFVYVQHLDRSHESALVPILQRETKMKVSEVKDGTPFIPDHLYIIPPNTDMIIEGGAFRLSDRADAPVRHSPIDRFFLSLAEKKREGSIAIILSGTASDGALGMKAIKEAGGITFAQDESAKFQSMPKSAIGEGIVDAILSPKEMAQELARFSQTPSLLLNLIPSGTDEEDNEDETEEVTAIQPEDIKKILRLIKNVKGVDFTKYKQNTIRRRIIRRMLLHKLESLPDYLDYMKKNTQEANLLYQDLLINVTHFFRDAEATEYLQKELLPELLKTKSAHNPLRIWVPACASGEEAYSLAIMLCEVMGEDSYYKSFQIFATDLSETAIAKARVGMYSTTDVMPLSKKRLDRFFTRVDGHYRIIKRIRDFCVFAPHNILKDPPFSRVDLISCCNLLIYLDTVLQQKVLANFHYALNKKGYLVLGKSETVGSSSNLFSVIDKKIKIYAKKSEVAAKAVFDINYQPDEVTTERVISKIAVKPTVKEISANESLEAIVDHILLTQYVPAGVVVNYDLDILQFRGSTGLFLEPSPGKASLHLLKMIRSGLELELRNAAHKVIKSGEPTKITGLDITHKGNIHHVAFEVIPLYQQTKEKLLLIIFEEVKTPSSVDLKVNFSKDRRVKQLEGELVALREDMRSLVEEQEAANEELQSANEEIVSSNEELQSINEELETSKEELESSNEELLTINQELQVRNDQLSEAHEYAERVIETIRESVIVLDKFLLVKTANKAFYRTFNTKRHETERRLIYEIGNGEWNIPKLKELFQEILPKQNQYYGFELSHKFEGIGEKVLLLSVKKIIQKTNGSELILVAIEDITEHRQAERLLEEREAWLRNMANNVPVMLWVAETNESFTFVNKTWLAFTGRSLNKETGIGWTEGIYKDDLDIVLSTYHSSFGEKKPFNIEYRMKRYDGAYRWILNSAVPTYDANGAFSGYTGSCIEIHTKKLLNEELEKRVLERTHELQEANVNLERSNSDLAQFAYVASHDLQEPLRKIITFSTRLKERFLNLIPQQGKDYIEKISFSSERMRNLIDDLLNFSRITRFEKKFVKTDLNKVVKDVLSDFDLLIQEKNAVLKINKMPVVEAVPFQMNQLFNNLLSNALKFASRSSVPTISIKCRRLTAEDLKNYNQLEKTNQYYEITFSDNGIGFSQEFADQIFIIFQRLNDKEDYPGTGIGLALCRKIVRNHGGEIIAKSEEGKGTTFYIILPVKQVTAVENEDQESL
ncbi:MAG: signal transduction histidine kinase with CheB and CheR [Segetibacter sp.]|nr:signal transduction histidine kinase with CheB and CheR [Segetibacter sp.]